MKVMTISSFLCCVLFLSQSALANPFLMGEMQKFQIHDRAQNMPEIIMNGLDETQRFLSDYKGQVVLLNLWATWCPPCIEELSSLDELEENLGGYDFKVIALSMDDEMTVDEIAQFLEEQGVEHLEPLLDHDNSTMYIPGLAGLPTTYLINDRGDLVATYEGDADWASDEAKQVIEYFIRAKPQL